MLRSWWKSATAIFRKKNKPVPWVPRHATTCPHNRNAATTATPQRSIPHPSLNPTIIITPPDDDDEPADTAAAAAAAAAAADYVDPLPLPLHESPFINLICLPNNQKTAPLTSTSSVNLTYTNHFHHTNTNTITAAAAAATATDDIIATMPASNLYYVYHHEPTPDHQFYHYAYYGTWIPIQDLPDPNKTQPKWIYNAEARTYQIIDHRLFGLRGECDCGVGKMKCSNARVYRAGAWRI